MQFPASTFPASVPHLLAALLIAALAPCAAVAANAKVDVQILWLERRVPPPPVLSNLDPVPDDLGLQGTALGIADSNTTGKFLGQSYTLTERYLEEDAPLEPGVLGGMDLVVAALPAADLQALADMDEARNALIFNAASADIALRREGCRANLFHTLPSRAMLADALAQFLVKKRWIDIFLISGPAEGDRTYAEAIRAAAGKFGLDIVADKPWPFAADMRRSAGAEVPLFSQVDDHDVAVVIDEAGDFARYIPYNTWRARPIAGSEGLVPAAWSRVVEQWGAAQLQSRFAKQAGRPMRSRDYAAWAAVRSIAEAVTRAPKDAPAPAGAAAVRAYLLSDAFQLAAFKGRKMSFRDWNGQLRQPIPLATARALVANAPLEGFLHPASELDTLGYDRKESGCTAFSE